jgi:hypothetical protein
VLGEKLAPLSFFPSLDLKSDLIDMKPTTNSPSYGMASLCPTNRAGFTVMGALGGGGGKQNVVASISNIKFNLSHFFVFIYLLKQLNVQTNFSLF